MTQTVIDMRSRPSYLHDFYGATPDTPSFEVVKWLNRRTGSQDELHFTRSKNARSFVEEIRAAGISQAVVVGRDTPGIKHSNDEIMKMVSEHKELVGIGSVDPHASGIKAATDEIERAVRKLGLKGINIEPGFCTPQVAADDAQLYPVYEACQALGVPVTIMSGPTTPRFELTDPASIGRVAKNFPKLKIVCYHGFWPYVNEMIGIAFRWDNVFVVADMYIFLPGGSLYVEAANGFMQDQLLFGSSYPFRAMGQSVEDYRTLGLKESVIDKVMGGNAKQVLGL